MMLLLPVPLLEGTEEDLDVDADVVVIADVVAVDVAVDAVRKERRSGLQSPSLVV